jgi:hypothetical protein
MAHLTSALAHRKQTSIEHEDQFTGFAPNHYTVRDNKTGNVLTEVHFQEGPRNGIGINGIHNEDLLSIVADRLEAYQNSPFACVENEQARLHITIAQMFLHKRTAERSVRGSEGTPQG